MSDLPATDRRVAADAGQEEGTTYLRSPDAKACRTSRRQRSTVITLLLAGALVVALGGAQAQAAPKGVVDIFGSAGTGAGQFNTPRGVAVNESTGHLYVVDSLNHRVQQFDLFGTFVRAWVRAGRVSPGRAPASSRPRRGSPSTRTAVLST